LATARACIGAAHALRLLLLVVNRCSLWLPLLLLVVLLEILWLPLVLVLVMVGVVVALVVLRLLALMRHGVWGGLARGAGSRGHGAPVLVCDPGVGRPG